MNLRPVWKFLYACVLVAVQVLFAAMIFAAAVYALAALGYWYADVYLFD